MTDEPSEELEAEVEAEAEPIELEVQDVVTTQASEETD